MLLRAASLVLLVVAVLTGATETAMAQKPREKEARELYAAGDYEEALKIYVKLYADTLHPTYLRNIGRCYQNIGQPEKAIRSFREYLRKAKALSAGERQEIEGYIREMEELKSKPAEPTPLPPAPTTSRSSPAPAAASAPPRANAAPEPAPAAAPPRAAPAIATAPPPEPAASLDATAPAPQTTAPDQDEGAPFYQRWWFWTGVVAVAAAATVVVLISRQPARPEGSAGTLDLRRGGGP